MRSQANQPQMQSRRDYQKEKHKLINGRIKSNVNKNHANVHVSLADLPGLLALAQPISDSVLKPYASGFTARLTTSFVLLSVLCGFTKSLALIHNAIKPISDAPLCLAAKSFTTLQELRCRINLAGILEYQKKNNILSVNCIPTLSVSINFQNIKFL